MRISDWSSDVCSSDLGFGQARLRAIARAAFPTAVGFRGEAGVVGDFVRRDVGGNMFLGAPRRAAFRTGFSHAVTVRAGLFDRFEIAGNARGVDAAFAHEHERGVRSEEHTSELQSLMRISYAVY